MDIIKTTLYAMSGLFGIFAALFKLMSEFNTESDRNNTKEKFGKIWKFIENSGFLLLSEKLIERLISFFKKVSTDYAVRLEGLRKKSMLTQLFFALGLALILGLFNMKFFYKNHPIVSVFVFAYPQSKINIVIYVVDLVFVNLVALLFEKKIRKRPAIIYDLSWLTITMFMLYGFLIIIFLLILSRLSPIVLFFTSSLFVPIFTFLFVTAMGYIKIAWRGILKDLGRSTDNVDTQAALLGISFGASFLFTTFAMFLGHSLKPVEPLPVFIWLLLSNITFDTLTVFLTYYILQKAIGSNRLFPISIAIIIDILVAALFACSSLFLGVYFTPQRVNIIQTFHVLIGHSIDGKKWDLGPYFWVMHTTFIPTLVYLMLILITLIGKYITLPFTKLFKRGYTHDKPFDLTAYTFTFLAISLLSIAKVFDYFLH